MIGVGGNDNLQVPVASHRLTDLHSGFDASQLRAEPIWITAARQGLTVAAQQVTQAPGPPGRPQPDGSMDPVAAATDRDALARPGVLVLNGYNAMAVPGMVLSASTDTLHDAAPWHGVRRRPHDAVPRELEWDAGPAHLYALFLGGRRYDRVIVSPARDARLGVELRPAPVERAPIGMRRLARQFGRPLRVVVGGRDVYINFRLFQLTPDLAKWMLYQADTRVVEGNDRAGASAYEAAIGGWTGNAPTGTYKRDGFGPTVMHGGDGLAELRYLETIELVTRQAINGAAWAWHHRHPALHLEYLPVVDEIDHLWYGWTADISPLAPAARARVQAFRVRGWSIADRHLAQLQAEARATRALLVVTSDHGMRPYHRVFRVNVALRDAGLLAADSAGKIDLARSKAVSPTGHFVVINRVERPDGQVLGGEVAALVDSIAHVLAHARDVSDRPIVSAVYIPQPADSLGIGGANGGDVYYGLMPGYTYSSGLGAGVSDTVPVDAGHGFPSVDRDMKATFCVSGPGIGARMLPEVRTIDVAPTVADWLDIEPPRDARGVPLLLRLLRHP
jgi:hypothetical protein